MPHTELALGGGCATPAGGAESAPICWSGCNVDVCAGVMGPGPWCRLRSRRPRGSVRGVNKLKLGRRRFLILSVGGGAAASLGLSPASAGAATTATVWRLNAAWGYAVPPKGRTRCRCHACRDNAANKVFATQAAAITGRIHPCCVCQPFSVELLVPDVASLFPGGVTVIDLTIEDGRTRFEGAVARNLAPAADPSPPQADPSPSQPDPSPSQPDPSMGPTAPSPVPELAPLAPTQVISPPAGNLPGTGVDADRTAIAAAIVLGVGAATVLASTRPETSPGPDPTDSATHDEL